MKKIFLLLFFIPYIYSYSQNTYIPDNAFENYLINYGYDSGPLDDYVPTNNIKDIETLFLNNLGIENFEGLQDFIGLKNLKIIAGSNVTNIDISKNINLIDFQIYGAPLLQNFDTSKNINLEVFTIEHNSINKVNLSKNINIKDITIGNTKIKNIDLSNNTKLEKIDLNYGILENLNLNNNQNTLISNFSCIGQLKLKCVRVDDEVYSKTNWFNITDSSVFSENCGNFEELTYVPDDGFEQHLIDLGYDSGVLDDYVPTNNINTIKDLAISGNANYIWNIKSLEGIEDFIALEKLTIDLNEVVSIDLSNNLNLNELYIINDALLKNLNISKNIDLEKFHCVNTSINTIDLSNNTIIKELTIGNSSLKNLDLSNNVKIEKINLNHGILENINFKNGVNSIINQFSCIDNPELKCVLVDNINYSKTNWTQIDDNSVFKENCNSQQLTYVPDDNFEQELINLGYDSGPLDDYVLTSNIENILELDINSKNITDLTGIQDFVSLTNLVCYNNSINDIKLNNLKNLTYLVINENKLTSLDISNNIKLISLSCGNNLLDKLDISNNHNLEQLLCSNNDITNLDLSSNLNLLILWCSHNQLNQLNLVSNKSLKRLSCGGNLFNTIDISKNNLLEEFYAPDGNLESLDLTNNPKINYFVVSNNNLNFLDLRNGANINIPGHSFNTKNNNLKCILVDDKNFSSNNWNSIDSTTTFVSNETECNALNCSITVDALSNQEFCDSYILPSIINGNFYTQSGGNGTQLNSGETVTSSQTIYIYNEDPINSSCFSETSFEVVINTTPIVDIISNIDTANSYTLPNLINGNYYTQSNGMGIQLNAGDLINSSQTIYIYNVSNTNLNCYNESSFTITINKSDENIVIPNYFTPNNDGKNDTWIVKADLNSIKEIFIADRFGKTVGKIKPNSKGWNGFYNGKQLPSNTYWYEIILTNGKTKSGSFALIRY